LCVDGIPVLENGSLLLDQSCRKGGEREREREREKTSDSTYHLFVLETDYPSVQRRKGKSMFE
jgi:hypothetical protein